MDAVVIFLLAILSLVTFLWLDNCTQYEYHLKKLGLIQYDVSTGEKQYLDCAGNVIQFGGGE